MVLTDEVIDGVVERQPEAHVDEEDPCRGDVHPYRPDGDEHDGERGQDEREHRQPGADTRAQELMVDMVLIGQEGITVVTDTGYHHPDDVEHRDEHRRETDDQHFTGEEDVGLTSHIDEQETDEITQRQTARITHEDLLAPLDVAKDIVVPEGQQDAEHAERHDHEEILGTHHRRQTQREQGHRTDARGQTIDTVDEVDGIRDIDHHEHRERDTHPDRNLSQPEQAGEIVDRPERGKKTAQTICTKNFA